MKLNEYSPREDLEAAIASAAAYVYKNQRSQKVLRAQRMKASMYVCVGNTPDKVPVMYTHFFAKQRIISRAFVIVDGSEGDSYVGEYTNGLFVIHSHAIRRYIERSGYEGKPEKAIIDIINETMHVYTAHDSDTYYVKYREGVFLCVVIDQVLHYRTWITDQQCHRNQLLFAKKSESEVKKFYENIKNQKK